MLSCSSPARPDSVRLMNDPCVATGKTSFKPSSPRSLFCRLASFLTLQGHCEVGLAAENGPRVTPYHHGLHCEMTPQVAQSVRVHSKPSPDARHGRAAPCGPRRMPQFATHSFPTAAATQVHDTLTTASYPLALQARCHKNTGVLTKQTEHGIDPPSGHPPPLDFLTQSIEEGAADHMTSSSTATKLLVRTQGDRHALAVSHYPYARWLARHRQAFTRPPFTDCAAAIVTGALRGQASRGG